MSKKRGDSPPRERPASSSAQPNSQSITQISAQFSGPLPAPGILERYDQIVRGAAERILVMAEEDARHQREMERAALLAQAREARRGQVFGLLIGLAALGTTVAALLLGYEKAAMVIGGTTVVGLVTVFITGRLKRSQ